MKILFLQLFKTDIEYLCSMTNLWKERKQPVPIDLNNLAENSASLEGNGSEVDDYNTVGQSEGKTKRRHAIPVFFSSAFISAEILVMIEKAQVFFFRNIEKII